MTNFPTSKQNLKGRVTEAFCWLLAVGLAGVLFFSVVGLASKPFTTTISSPLALPKELAITSKTANIPLPGDDGSAPQSPTGLAIPTIAPVETSTTIPGTTTTAPGQHQMAPTTSEQPTTTAAPAPAPAPTVTQRQALEEPQPQPTPTTAHPTTTEAPAPEPEPEPESSNSSNSSVDASTASKKQQSNPFHFSNGHVQGVNK